MHSTSSGSHTLCGGLQDRALCCPIWDPTVLSYARRGNQGSVTQGMTGKGDEFCVREFNDMMITSLHGVASIHAQSCYFAILLRVFFGRSFLHNFRPKRADPQRGVSKIWHCPRLINVHTYLFRSAHVTAQTLCALQLLHTCLDGRSINNSIAGEERLTQQSIDRWGSS